MTQQELTESGTVSGSGDPSKRKPLPVPVSWAMEETDKKQKSEVQHAGGTGKKDSFVLTSIHLFTQQILTEYSLRKGTTVRC